MATTHTQITQQVNNQAQVATQERNQARNGQQQEQKDLVRESTPQQLNQLWRILEQNQDIHYSYAEEEVLESDDSDETSEEDVMDSEVSLADEDALDDDDNEDDDSASVFYLNVTIDADGKAHCQAPDFGTYLSATPVTSLGENCLSELSNRDETLCKLADWLEDNRQKYLKSRNIDDLGEKAWNEYKQGELPIFSEKCQGKALSEILGIAASTFPKHIKNVALKWEGVMVSLDILFGKEAKEAWAVSAYKNMPEMNNAKADENLKIIAKVSGIDAQTIKDKANRA